MELMIWAIILDHEILVCRSDAALVDAIHCKPVWKPEEQTRREEREERSFKRPHPHLSDVLLPQLCEGTVQFDESRADDST